MKRHAIQLGLGGALLCATLFGGACGDSDSACSGPSCGGAGGDGGTGGNPEPTCTDSGVLYGPWSLRFDETSAVVRWDGCKPHATGLVIWPEDDANSKQTFDGEQTAWEVTTSYDVLDDVKPDLPGTYYLTEVKLTDLSPGECYRYQVEADADRAGRLCTAKANGEPFTFMAIGDTNPGIGDTAGVFDATLAHNPDFALHLGDMQYYDSLFDSWAEWFPAMAPLLEQGALMPSLGNHEFERPDEFVDYYERLFGNAGFDGQVEFYRFQSGGVWFFSLSTEMDLQAGSQQADWLEAQLQDAFEQPGFRGSVVFYHRPWITLADEGQMKAVREHFAPIFAATGVVLLLQGHVHAYERFVEGNVTFITSGGGGAALQDVMVLADRRPEELAAHMTSAKQYNGVVFDVGIDSIVGRALNNDDEIIDEFTIPLPNTTPTPR